MGSCKMDIPPIERKMRGLQRMRDRQTDRATARAWAWASRNPKASALRSQVKDSSVIRGKAENMVSQSPREWQVKDGEDGQLCQTAQVSIEHENTESLAVSVRAAAAVQGGLGGQAGIHWKWKEEVETTGRQFFPEVLQWKEAKKWAHGHSETSS